MTLKSCLLLSVLFLFSNQLVLGQVGINTDDPDPSAVLDVFSETSGLLMPRMTSAQRIAISDPAEGLIVYDISNNNIYVFQDGAWARVGEKRSNFKIVKTLDDLEEELAAGGNIVYQLFEDTLYEINGSISLNFPININGAYIVGEDTNEDILVNAIAGNTPLIQGFGGRIRNITFEGNSKPIFNIDGSAVSTSSLVVSNCIFSNSNTIGTLQSLSLAFFDVSQYRTNQDGLNLTDINSLYFVNQFWVASNQGTFLELNGSFDNIQMSTGRIVADTAEIGLDVSSNPTVDNSASISQISFVGEGTLVDRYTTGSYPDYNFSNDWYVNCQGIPLETDRNATGDINLNIAIGSGLNTTFTGTGAGSRRKLPGTTNSNELFRFTSTGNNRIVYEGEKIRFFAVTGSISYLGDTADDIYIFYIAKGNSGDATATVIPESRVYSRVAVDDDINAVTTIDTVQLGPGDFIEVWAERFGGTGAILTASINLIAR